MGCRVLVTGGAGYIGSHACKALARAGHVPVVLDNLTQGHRAAVRWGPLVEGDLGDPALVRRTLREYEIAAVMHFAAHACVEESPPRPGDPPVLVADAARARDARLKASFLGPENDCPQRLALAHFRRNKTNGTQPGRRGVRLSVFPRISCFRTQPSLSPPLRFSPVAERHARRNGVSPSGRRPFEKRGELRHVQEREIASWSVIDKALAARSRASARFERITATL